MPRTIELLAPARNLETAMAAISAGADAIFIGGSDFGARSGAGNSNDDLKTLCDYAHMFNVKVHVTLNTLLYDNELERMQSVIYDVARAGVDVIIFQDLSILTMDIPEGIELHASTQCDVSTKERFLFYKDLNVSQIVLPREITLNELKELKSIAGDVKLEVFVAGALCVAQSGICFISELMTDRSANRGSCAQICRLPMAMYDKHDKSIASGHLISMKDNFLLEDLEDLIEAGASSFKIEGRLKDKEYVINMVSLFSKKLNSIIQKSGGRYKRSSNNHVSYSFTANPFKTFNRGFTSSMLRSDNAFMVNIKTPKSLGERIGLVQKSVFDGKNTQVFVKSEVKNLTIANNDGFSYVTDDGVNAGFMCNRAEVTDKKNIYKIFIHGRKSVPAGIELYRNEDTAFKKLINRADACIRHIPLIMSVYTKGDELFISYTDECGSQGQASVLNTAADSENYLDFNRVLDKCYKIKSKDHSIVKVLNTPVHTDDIKALFKDINGQARDDNKLYGTDSATKSPVLLKLYMPISKFNELRYAAFDNYLKSKGQVRRDYKYKNVDTYPVYPERYVDKRLILNKVCADFYTKCQVDLDKAAPKMITRSVMTCKNCLVKNHSLCKKEGGSTTGFYLKIGDKRFDIVCDCVACKMHLFAHEETLI